ncbi:MAG: DMT family transporter [Deltaproteobacteria bacterium]|jgi:drug/metabolite transporter (DMT)-like permease|nr:DMT family transporter [Deltaproteobacteria bacterium]
MLDTRKQSMAALSLLFVTAIWGSTFIFVKWTIAELDLYYFLFLRFFIASAFMSLVFYRRLKMMSFATLKAGAILGLFLTGTYVAQTEGLQYTTASNSALITGLYMVVVPFCSILYLKKKPSLLSIVGVTLAIPGLFFLTQYSLTGINIGDIITMIVPFTCAWHITLTGKYAKDHPVVPLVVVQFIFAMIVCGAMTLFRGSATTSIPSVGWLTLGVTAIFATCLAFAVQTAAQRVIDPTRTGIIFAMEAVFGALFGWWLGGEVLTMLAFVGACLMVMGMIVSEIHPLTKHLIDKIVG